MDVHPLWDLALRVLAATFLGMAIGFERALRGKPTGMRTLGLVGFGASLATAGTLAAPGVQSSVDALSRVLQGIDQGVLVGIGFLGGGVILRDPKAAKVMNLTTAAEVWVVAAAGLVTAVAPWPLLGMAALVLLALTTILRMLEKRAGLKDPD
jgi:putative Mg2+ transporter-C (MgtC) family protein